MSEQLRYLFRSVATCGRRPHVAVAIDGIRPPPAEPARRATESARHSPIIPDRFPRHPGPPGGAGRPVQRSRGAGPSGTRAGASRSSRLGCARRLARADPACSWRTGPFSRAADESRATWGVEAWSAEPWCLSRSHPMRSAPIDAAPSKASGGDSPGCTSSAPLPLSGAPIPRDRPASPFHPGHPPSRLDLARLPTRGQDVSSQSSHVTPHIPPGL